MLPQSRENDVAVVDAGGGAPRDSFFCFDVDSGFVGERKGWIGWGDLDGAAMGALEEAVGGQLIEVPSDSDLRNLEGGCHLFDLCFAGVGEGLEYRLFSFLKIHVIHLFLNIIDQK